MKAAISDTEIDTTVKPICRRALQRRPQRRGAFFEVAESVLDHDDSVVDHKADADRECHQRQVVDGKARGPHRGAGAGEGERNGHAGCRGRCRPPQKQKHDEHHESDGRGERKLHIVHAGPDGLRAITQHRNVETFGHPLPKLGQQFVDPVNGVDDVGVSLFGNDEQNRRVFVEPSRRTRVAHARADGGNARQTNDRAVDRLDDNRIVFAGIAQLVVDADRDGPLAAIEGSKRAGRI